MTNAAASHQDRDNCLDRLGDGCVRGKFSALQSRPVPGCDRSGHFTLVRLASGTCVLCLILSLRRRPEQPGGSWPASVALFAYAAAFSFAYASLPAGTGSLLLFGAVQTTMVGYGSSAVNVYPPCSGSTTVAVAGLAALVAPGAMAPSVTGACLMLTAGVAWGAYSLLGRGIADPQRDGRQLRAFPANPNWSFFIRPVVRHEPHRHRTRLCDPFRRRCVRAGLYDLVRGAPGADACARRLGATDRSGHYGFGRRLSARRSNLPSPFHVIACDTRRNCTGLRQSRTRAIWNQLHGYRRRHANA